MKAAYTLGALALMVLCSVIITGCKTVGIVPQITPARIEAVTALGAYFGAKEAVTKGKRGDIERALAGLKSIQASGKADIPAVVKALADSGITFFSSTEGQLAIGAAVVFSDAWAGTAQPILDDERTRAVLAGTIRGFELALTQPVTRSGSDPTAELLTARAKATR